MVEYTIDDIRGPTVAREMAQLKSFVLEKFNGAIADAEAAAAAAATAAANAVIGSLTTRVGALENDMTTAQGDIVTNANAILALDSAAVKLAGTQTITGTKNVPLEATGTASNQIASSQKVKNELDNYAPMLRTSGNQNFSGIKKASATGFFRKASATMNLATPPSGTSTDETYVLEDTDGTTIVSNFNSFTPNSQTIYQISTKYPFEENGVIKVVMGAIWLAVYNNRLVLYIRYTDKNGTSHLKQVAAVSETDP